MNNLNLTMEQVMEAINGSGGIVSVVMRKLGVAWHTADGYIKKWEETRRAFANENEIALDMAESELLKKVQGGDDGMIKFLLKTKGKKRGYVERSEITGDDGGPVRMNLSSLTDAQLEALAAIYEDQD